MGCAGMHFTPTVAQAYALTVLYEGQPINNGQNTVTVAVAASQTPAVTSIVAAFDSPVVAGSTGFGWFRLRDLYGNVITDLTSGGSGLAVTLSPDLLS